MDSSQISIAPYNITLLIVISHSTFILTYAKSSLAYALLTIGWLDTFLIPSRSDWMIAYLPISWMLTYTVLWLATYCVYKTLIFAIESQSWAGLSS